MRAILGILGPTGVGKSAVAVETAKLLNSAVVSCDSMQIFKGLDICTAKISKNEQKGIKHFMLDVVDPDEHFSAFDFQDLVGNQILPIFESKNAVPILAGGTGLYFDSLIFGLDFPSEDNKLIRQQMTALYEEKGHEALLQVLKEKDEITFNEIDKNNIQRVVRAIEIAENGQSLYGEKKPRVARFRNKLFILTRSREQIYANIDRRVDNMVKAGLFDEVKRIFEKFGSDKNFQSLTAIGCKEAVDFLSGKTSKDEAIEKIKLNTHHYAKRQLTYFKRMQGEYIDVEKYADSGEIAKYIVESYLNYENTNLL